MRAAAGASAATAPQGALPKYPRYVTRTVIDLDDDLLAKAAAELGTVTKKDTVHAALRAVVQPAAARKLRALIAEDSAGPAHEAAANAMWENEGPGAGGVERD
jgi:Arc/MetJ family transcription regulator